jgi:hypothetical protein
VSHLYSVGWIAVRKELHTFRPYLSFISDPTINGDAFKLIFIDMRVTSRPKTRIFE